MASDKALLSTKKKKYQYVSYFPTKNICCGYSLEALLVDWTVKRQTKKKKKIIIINKSRLEIGNLGDSKPVSVTLLLNTICVKTV